METKQQYRTTDWSKLHRIDPLIREEMDAETLTEKAQECGYYVTFTPAGEIRTVVPTGENPLALEIYPARTLFGKHEPTKVITCSWGPKSSEEVAEVIAAYENARAMVELIEEYRAAR